MEKILEEMRQEGIRQNKKGFNANHDDSHSLEDMCDHIIAYTTWAREMLRMGSPEKFRKRIMQTGTIAAKTCESFDRRLHKEKYD